MPINDPALAEQLLVLDSPEDVEAFLRRVEGPDVLEDDRRWRPVGGLSSNAGSIEASADEINPIVERIVNGIESVIELEVARATSDPQSAREAIETLFSIPQGAARLLDESAAQQMADRVLVSLRGSRAAPTIVVRDRGIGVHPDEFESTILSLQRSEKGQKPYLVGMYGQGGSSTFDKCEYTVIVSRRAPDCLGTGQDGSLGWTVVRKRLDVRANVYSYLVARSQDVIPRISEAVHSSVGFDHGTHIAHVGYRGLRGFAEQQITNNAWFTLNYRLFDPLLPYTLQDERTAPPQRRTMRGVPYRADSRPRTSGIGSIEARRRADRTAVRHHVSYDHPLSSGSHLKVEWWIFQDEQAIEGRRIGRHSERVRPYRDQTQRYAQRTVTITRGGQTHAAVTPLLFRQSGLREVSRSIVVNVNTDGLSFAEGAGFFSSNRADLKRESEDLIEDALRAAINLHIDELRAIERERRAEIVSGKSASDEEQIRRWLDPLIRAFHRQTIITGRSTDGTGRERSDFVGRETPTYLRFRSP